MTDNDQRAWLDSARAAFPSFYATATPGDTELLNSLVLGHLALVVLINTPREHVAPALRSDLERAANATEQLFSNLREAVRNCRTFVALHLSEKEAIERIIFNVGPLSFG